ncbi:hypothetical protein [Yinghuangia soli]|uniref:hypothetical protein n=1 Tax=Yinghuangia soli TaxID=2908204 RepID=UPI003556DA69
MIDPNVRSTMPFAVGANGGAGWTEIPSASHAAVNARDTKTFPRSTTIVSGTATGRAAAPASRSSSAVSRRWGSTRDRSNRSTSGHVGRAGRGTATSASSSAASTACVPPGHSTAARIARVATSTAMVSSGRPTEPSSNTARTSSRVVSTWTCSPGRSATVGTSRCPSSVTGGLRTGLPGWSAGWASWSTSR